MDYKHRALVKLFNGKLGNYLKEHHRDILGRMTNPAQQAHIADELHGVSSGNPNAKELADGINATLEDMRLQFNEAGGLTSKLDNWGLPHVHSKLTVMRAGFDRWFQEIDGRLDWARINDPLTGKPIARGPDGKVPEAFRRSYLKSAYENIVFGKGTENPVYGLPDGVATYRKHTDQRQLHFKSGKDWMEYNRDFGTGGLHASLMGHVHRMARDIVLMREFGPNPKLGAKYEADLWQAKAKKAGDESLLAPIASDSAHALRMLNVMSGGNVSQDPMQQWVSTFMSSTRSLLGAAQLDRAIVSSLSDLNTARMAAKSMGMNPGNLIGKHVGLMQSLTRDELLRAGWVADTMADAGTAVARFQQEVAPVEWVERVTQASMRIQGLSAWTDRARATVYQEFSGFMAGQVDRAFSDLTPELRKHLGKWKITAADWDEFRRPEHLFTAGNGATFAMPLNFRNVTTLPTDEADALFFKIQGAAEEFIELAVPTKSLLAQGLVDPAAYNLPPGSILYEIAKSGMAYKSFPMTFTVNQYRQIMNAGGFKSAGGWKYIGDMVAGATIMGAISLQANEILMGRDPQDMTDPLFFGRAMAKGGGAGILGDIVTTGQASWGGGFAGYLSGPVPQAAQDVWGLTIGNALTAAYQAATGQEVNVKFGQALAKFGKRYTPMGQTPLVGPALDRLVWDQLAMALDPEAQGALVSAAKRRANLNGSGDYWMPGDALPSRAPNLGNALGQ